MNEYQAQSKGRAHAYMYRVFGWMAYALSLTGFTSYFIASSPALSAAVIKSPMIIIGLCLLQLVLVVALSSMVTTLSYSTAFTLFSVYSVLSGITLSIVFMAYTTGSLVATFFVAAGMFGAMALYGATTETDLSPMGSFLIMALFGLIISMLINWFVQSAAFDLVISMIGVVVFAGLTAWDMQKLQIIAQQIDTKSPGADTIALVLALQLYLDFINLFLYLLRIMGERKK